MMKGTVIVRTGAELHVFTFPNGRVEMVNGLARALWLGICLTRRGYHIKVED